VKSSSFSLINQGSGFARFFPDSLQNTGTGRNYGLELTVQKFFNKSFFFLFSASLYNSKYKGSDGIERNTSYNGNYATNFLAGKEFKLNEKQSISAGLKMTYAGGRRYGYVDIAESELRKEVIFSDSAFNDRQFKDYFRLDLKVNWKFNAKSMTHEIGLDLVNILNTKNLLGLAYAPDLADPTKEPLAEKQQLGFLPIFYYKVDFKVKRKE
jgi:outer membrane receptor protein involved in Fe transport